MQCLQHLNSVVAAKIAIDGGLVLGNAGFSRLLEGNPDAGTRIDVRDHFLNPSFSQLLAVQSSGVQPVFIGILNLADKHGIGRSLIGTVHRDDRHLTLMAEYDVDDMERLNAHVIDLNVELAEVQRNLARANRTLQGSRNQLKVLAGGVLEMQECERRILAYELHEELGQSLAAVMINLKSPVRSASQQHVELDAQAVEMVNDALHQVRRLAHTLRPAALDDLGLVPALRWLAQQTQARNGLAIEVTATEALVRVESRPETVCFRVVEEALSNVVRHAKATTVKLVLDQGVNDMVLGVHDNGVGFDLALVRDRTAALGGIGLLGMEERVSSVGGQLEILSTPGAGTTVRLHFVLAHRT
ncbi:MAG: sensor histidine kinase [Rhodoferax sp.]|nr:sensor histidine kinase [Rhodoferax sp.]